jgi:hypothetical protein
MGMNQTCEHYATCPVFNGILQGMETTVKIYKRQYCEAGPEGWHKCKRYQVKQKTGICPPDLLPNSIKTLEQIITAMS